VAGDGEGRRLRSSPGTPRKRNRKTAPLLGTRYIEDATPPGHPLMRRHHFFFLNFFFYKNNFLKFFFKKKFLVFFLKKKKRKSTMFHCGPFLKKKKKHTRKNVVAGCERSRVNSSFPPSLCPLSPPSLSPPPLFGSCHQYQHTLVCMYAYNVCVCVCVCVCMMRIGSGRHCVC
jgi:hypothetical protein